jgi:deoxycytidine triphosphate deaminase
MVLGSKKLLKLVKEKNLIENLSERELNNPESCVFDIRIKEISQLEGEGFLGIEDRQTPEHKMLASYDGRAGKIVTLEPGEYYMTESIEIFHMPENLFGIVKPRSTLFRSGLMLRAGVIDPGYNGPIHPGLFNASKLKFKLEMGARYIQVFFFEIDGGLVRAYEGQWQGGRKSASKREKQN